MQQKCFLKNYRLTFWNQELPRSPTTGKFPTSYLTNHIQKGTVVFVKIPFYNFRSTIPLFTSQIQFWHDNSGATILEGADQYLPCTIPRGVYCFFWFHIAFPLLRRIPKPDNPIKFNFQDEQAILFIWKPFFYIVLSAFPTGLALNDGNGPSSPTILKALISSISILARSPFF